MNIAEAIRIALQSLWANKLRSVLTLLGVVIGVAAVIAVVTFVNGINGYLAEKIFNLGADVFIISKVTPVITDVDQLLALGSAASSSRVRCAAHRKFSSTTCRAGSSLKTM